MEHEAVTKARNNGDIGVLIAGLAVLAFIGLIFLGVGLLIALAAEANGMKEQGIFAFISNNIVYIIIAFVFLGLAMMATRILRQTMLGNALQVEYSDYAWLREWSNKVAADLQMPKVEIFVTQDPTINAYAVGFYGPYTIVLNSGSIRYLTDDELKMVVIHEMGHVKYHHTKISVYLSFITSYPIVGILSSYVLSFWRRRTELTADRLALTYGKDPELLKKSLIKVHVGPDVAKDFNGVARQWQAFQTRGVFNLLSQTFSDHPFLVRRLQHIDKYAYLVQSTPETSAPTTPPAY